MAKVYFRGSRSMARQFVHLVALSLAGKATDQYQIARGVFVTLGFAALSSIKQDFIVKSRGGVGQDGEQWKPLRKEYLAYQRRFGPGEKAALKKAAGVDGKTQRFGVGGNGGLLTAAQKKRWGQIFATRFHRFLLSMDAGSAKAKAAAIAWATIKREGAKTLLEVFGNRTVEINRDTGVLFNSLSPGELSGSGAQSDYQPVADQVFDLMDNGVIVGTSVPYGEHVNKQRSFLPTTVPDNWEQRWLDSGMDALAIGIQQTLGA